MFQEETLKLLVEKSGATRMGHILLTLPFIRAAADRTVIQVLVSFSTIQRILRSYNFISFTIISGAII